jgi:protoporphyrinogen IX oxidase
MLWLKAFHIIFVVTWFAGLFYLPRLFVYHCETTDAPGYERFCVMERKLFAIASIGMVGALVFGGLLWVGYWPARTGWLWVKLAVGLALVGYHHWLIVPLRAFRERRNSRSARFYRIVNELPAAFLVALVLLAVLKPF